MLFQQKPREEQAENGNVELTEKAGFMLGTDRLTFARFFVRLMVSESSFEETDGS